jgi:hypothetical protein
MKGFQKSELQKETVAGRKPQHQSFLFFNLSFSPFSFCRKRRRFPLALYTINIKFS